MSKDEPTALEIILEKLYQHDARFEELASGQTEIKTQLATHEERSLNQHKRIERVEKITGGISLAMIVAVLSIVLSGCGLLSGLKPAPTEPVLPEAPKVDVVSRAVRNTVALQTEDGRRFCSGVAAEGAIVTAEHCVDGDEPFEILYQGKAYPAVVVWSDETLDLAIVDAVGARIQKDVPLAEKAPVIGNKVVWMGYPLGEDFIMGTGIVGNPSVYVAGATFMAVYGQFIPGNSGGPVFNYKGELIGIVSMTMAYNNNYLPVGYAVPLEAIKGAL